MLIVWGLIPMIESLIFVGGQIRDNKVNNNKSINHQSCLFQVKYKDACSMHTHMIIIF